MSQDGRRDVVTRTSLLAGGLVGVAALASASCAAGADGSPTHHSITRKRAALLQSNTGTRTRSGTSISCAFESILTKGSLLIAVISRETGSASVPTIGQVSDGINHWKQVVETTNLHNLGIDLWCCEASAGGTKPTVTASVNGFPHDSITGMKIALLEYSGFKGSQLVDQIGVTSIAARSVSVATNFATTQPNELLLSVVTGDMHSATAPSGWNARLADVSQRFWIADNLDSGSDTGVQTAAWTGLERATNGGAVIVAFRTIGRTSGPVLLQDSYTNSNPSGSLRTVRTSQRFSVDPTAGNTLVAMICGGDYSAEPYRSCDVTMVTDSVGGLWQKVGDQLADDRTGVKWSIWVCDSAVGGSTSLTVTFDPGNDCMACLLMELTGMPPINIADSIGTNSFRSIPLVSTNAPVLADDVAFYVFSWVFDARRTPAAGWIQVFSDTSGCGAMGMMPATPVGILTATLDGSGGGAYDSLLVAIRAAEG